MGLDGGQDRVDPLRFLEVGLNLQTGPVPWIERKSVRRLIRRVVEPEALRAEIGVGGVGNDLGMAGGALGGFLPRACFVACLFCCG